MLNHEQKFPSKKGFVIYTPLIILVVLEATFVAGGLYTGAILILAVMSGLFLPIFFYTSYSISANGYLIVKSGWVINRKIPVSSITKAENTGSILSAPALSLDRLELFYNQFDSVVISPVDKALFVAELQKINPGIRYQL